jgi:hypothetical protein
LFFHTIMHSGKDATGSASELIRGSNEQCSPTWQAINLVQQTAALSWPHDFTLPATRKACITLLPRLLLEFDDPYGGDDREKS